MDLRGRKLQEDGEKRIIRSFIIFTLPLMGDQTKEDKVGEACSTNMKMRNLYKVLVGMHKGK